MTLLQHRIYALIMSKKHIERVRLGFSFSYMIIAWGLLIAPTWLVWGVIGYFTTNFLAGVILYWWALRYLRKLVALMKDGFLTEYDLLFEPFDTVEDDRYNPNTPLWDQLNKLITPNRKMRES